MGASDITKGNTGKKVEQGDLEINSLAEGVIAAVILVSVKL